MAACENCEKIGFQPNQLHANDDGTKLIGPCCQSNPQLLPPVPDETEVNWGFSISSKNGLEMFASVGDLKLEYVKRPQELKEMVSSIR